MFVMAASGSVKRLEGERLKSLATNPLGFSNSSESPHCATWQGRPDSASDECRSHTWHPQTTTSLCVKTAALCRTGLRRPGCQNGRYMRSGETFDIKEVSQDI
jgi:hypothetical protein